MNIAESTAAWVLDSPSLYPPPGLGGHHIARPEVYYPPAHSVDMQIHAHAPEWVPQSVSRQSIFDSLMEDAKRNLTHAFASAKRATQVAEDATAAAKIATDAASSASESVKKAANIVRELQRMYANPVQDMPARDARAVSDSTVRAISAAAAVRSMPAARVMPAAARVMPAAARVMPAATSLTISTDLRGGSKAPSTSPIGVPGTLQRGTDDCFNKQQGIKCRPYRGKPCKYCK